MKKNVTQVKINVNSAACEHKAIGEKNCSNKAMKRH